MGVLDIFTEHLVVRVRLIVYLVLVFFSFFIFVGAAVMKDKYWNGYCPLYATVSDPLPSVANCNYPMAIAIMLQLIYTLFRIVSLTLLVLGKFTTEMFLFNNILELVYVLLDVTASILTFIGACILSAGANASIFLSYSGAKTASNVAQAGAWISTFLWIFVAVFGVVYLLRSGKIPFARGGGGTAANTGQTGANAPPPETTPNYDPPKY